MNEKVVVNRIVASESSINGWRKQKAKDFVHELMSKHTRGIFRDDYWVPVNAIWKSFREEGLDVDLKSAEYYNDRNSGEQAGKKWVFEINFINQNGMPDKLHGNIIASWAGSVSDPSSAYDLAAYCS